MPEFCAHQLEFAAVPEAPAAFTARWRGILANRDAQGRVRTIVVDEHVVGYIAQFTRSGQPEVSYCLGTQYWGNGFATEALRLFRSRAAPDICARGEEQHPLDARAAEVRLHGRGRGSLHRSRWPMVGGVPVGTAGLSAFAGVGGPAT